MKKGMPFALLLLACFASTSVFALEEKITVPSRTLSEQAFLGGDDPAVPEVMLSGMLEGPHDAGEPRPVVILLHGTDGPRSGAAGTWRRYLNDIGITTFRLDSYTGRGIEEAQTDQNAFGQFTQIYDAYRAADVLAADPRIDASRVVLMGFSRGGNAALYSAMTRFRDAFGPERATIVAHIPFYPACNFEFVGEIDVADAPIREFHGSEDDWTPAEPCRDYIARLAAAGADAEMTEYPEARHAFDNLGNPSYFSDPDAQTSRACFRREVDGRLVNAATGAPFSYDDACVEYGPSSQYNDAAATAAQDAVKEILAEVFAK